jgi:DHA1 family multidrug resistance protein-like MFS transporter
MMAIFMQGFNYVIDCFLNLYVPSFHETHTTQADLVSAASAFAANTMMRSLVGACFPLFTRQMFHNLGIQWASTLLGCLAVMMIPIPLLLMKFGARLRRLSKLAPVA